MKRKMQLTPAQIKWREENIPNLHNGAYRRKYTKALLGSLRAAVDSKCLYCVCWQQAKIAKCGVPTCPLYNVRRHSDSAPGEANTEGSEEWKW